MKLSIEWLQEWLDSPVDAEVLASTLTRFGLEVESLRPVAGEFQNVIVGQIKDQATHPDAKRLHCCLVNVGNNQSLPIVCGGVNVRPGLKVAVAMIGAKLPNGMEIKQSLLRGAPSHGMLCSAQELGLGEDKEGYILELSDDAPIGKDLRDYLCLNDQIIDIALTANRGDCLSIKGMARESAALLDITDRPHQLNSVQPVIPDTLTVELSAPSRCPRYIGRIIRHIKNDVQTPVWMQERLRRSGMRSIHPVVDITNYVMLELGQPLHAFNLDSIVEKIQVRMANPGEILTLLDGRRLDLQVSDLVISDQVQPLALAGIMGGQSSGVAADTRNLFLESAFFTRAPLSLTARHHRLQTDSSYRFARGVDFDLCIQAMERATQLLVDIVGGQPGLLIEKTEFNHLPKPMVILLRRQQIARVLGIELTDCQVKHILQSLGMSLVETPDGWQVQVPSYRYDLTLEIDLIEELGRLHGYHHIPLQPLMVAMRSPLQSTGSTPSSRWLNLLVDRGYCEAITYSFVSPRWQEWLDPDHIPVRLANPISTEMSVMRTNLWSGLLQALKYNQNRQISRVRLFESGLCFLPLGEQTQQIEMLGGVVCGSIYPEQWGVVQRSVDFFDVKADIEALLALSGQSHCYSWRQGQHPALHPGQNAELWFDNQWVGRLGSLHPSVVEKCELVGNIFLFELKLDIIKLKQLNEFKSISKFPGVRRDIAVMIAEFIPAEAMQKFILRKAGKLLNNVQIFDVYEGQNIQKGQKSIALSLSFQNAARTLKDDEIQAIVDYLIKELEQEFNAKLRM